MRVRVRLLEEGLRVVELEEWGWGWEGGLKEGGALVLVLVLGGETKRERGREEKERRTTLGGH